MKTVFVALSLILTLGAAAQATYNSPESVEFDYANNRWFIANNGGNNILVRNSSNGARTVFATGFVSGPHGLEIVNDTLYACDGASLKAYNINTGALVFNKAMGASFLNGITHDNSGNLYITDYSAKKIYRFDITTRTSSVFVAATGAGSPNGIIFDQPNNRCLFVNFSTSAIKAVDLTTAVVSTVLSTPTLGNCDGITKDGAGNYYVSSWGINGIARFNNTFTTGPTTVVTGLSSPADIFYNVVTDTLGNPNSGSANNTTYHYFGSATGIAEAQKAGKLNFTVTPNPIIRSAELNYELAEGSNVLIELYDARGSLVKTILNEKQAKGKQTSFFSRNGLKAGSYLVKIETDNFLETKRIIIAD
ncbi:MAG: hypothetical protein K0Q95_2279 [Bacteroidota bacterium]|jgi:hypothetical protein|nr:hypothetical protein [Bacteroidota bacterium]